MLNDLTTTTTTTTTTKIQEYCQSVNDWDPDQARHFVGPRHFDGLDLGPNCLWERSGSVVECLTRDRRAEGSSLTGSLRCGP